MSQIKTTHNRKQNWSDEREFDDFRLIKEKIWFDCRQVDVRVKQRQTRRNSWQIGKSGHNQRWIRPRSFKCMWAARLHSCWHIRSGRGCHEFFGSCWDRQRWIHFVRSSWARERILAALTLLEAVWLCYTNWREI